MGRLAFRREAEKPDSGAVHPGWDADWEAAPTPSNSETATRLVATRRLDAISRGAITRRSKLFLGRYIAATAPIPDRAPGFCWPVSDFMINHSAMERWQSG